MVQTITPKQRLEILSTIPDVAKAEFDALVEVITPAVQNINRGPQFTQHHYGAYAGVINTLCEVRNFSPRVAATILLVSGADVRGVRSCMSVMFQTNS